MIDQLNQMLDRKGPRRLLIEALLKPVQGRRFQPTGFPDLGVATYEHGGETHAIVESAQSMANRMEAVCWDPAERELVPFLRGLSYVRVNKDGDYLTSSIVEAHRLNSPYILESKDKTFLNALIEETAPFTQGQLDRPKLAMTIFAQDVSCLLHGLFLAKKELAGGRLRLERSLSAFIEAEDVNVAAYGGVKRDDVNPSGVTAKGFGHVPYQRDEYVAERITAFFNLDLTQIRGYGLPPECGRLLIVLGLYKIQAVLDEGLRLRTACDLDVVELQVTQPGAFALPSRDELEALLPGLIKDCAPHFRGVAGVTTVNYEA